MNKKVYVSIGLLILSLLSFSIGRWSANYTIVPVTKEIKIPNQASNNVLHESNSENDYQISNANNEGETVIPQKVYEVLSFIRENNRPPDNYVGGRTFYNREKLLPLNDTYKEWDVNPKISGKNRGAERLVTSETKAYYTKDHYQSFIQIKE